MSLFKSCSGFEINGGDFYVVAGDMNLQRTQPTIERNIDPLAALEFDLAEGPSRQLLGAERNGRHHGAEKMLPYVEDISHRTRIPTSISTAVDSLQQPPIACRTDDVDPITDPSTNFELPTSSHIDPFPGNFGGFVAPINRPSWEEPVSHAPRTSINGGTFIGGNVNHIQRSGEPGLHILCRAAAGDATHDSEDRYSEPRCHPETRTKMLDVLWKWTSGTEPPTKGTVASSLDNPSSPILWLHGPAGAGESAIAQSICQKLEEEARLGASFFFKRGHSSRGHAKRLCATIAYQLALLLPELKRHISQSVENDPSLVDKSLEIQLQKLIIEPLRLRQTRMGATATPGLVVVIDGLDECEDPNIQQRILLLISRAVDKQQLPIRFLVASRPEPHICEIFSGALNGIHSPVNVEQSFEDVRRYLLDEFTRIHDEHRTTMAMVPYPWPSQEMVDTLVRKSSGYFIYASTVVKFIDNKNCRPGERLEMIVGIKEPDSGSPFAALDRLYTGILSQVHARPLVLKILTVILAGHKLLPSYIDQLLELESGDVLLALRELHSVIKITENCLDFHHNSFHDFLKDPARAGIFYVGHSHQMDLCRHILRALSYAHDHPSLNRHGHVSW
ncbi:hypothetical protein GGX14DRAFT_646481 [Mycena pura]|uniref:Nephrocystin 3-like N-terminal domain-containing protein n=1 Tax=Mycena pura TaxID=153505 RepID=A0AAD6V7R5_9AGAR|nr:hypothetical protein GGX14DRAFT_646481 [Mycena pura]